MQITIKKAYDSEGGFSHLELHQGTNCIKLKFSNSLDKPQSYHWETLRSLIDSQRTFIEEEVRRMIDGNSRS